MIIPLKTQLEITYLRYEDKGKVQLLADLIDRKLKENRSYQERINKILVECADECMAMLAPISQP